MENQSEVALLRAQIDLEVAALQMIRNGFAQVASHEVIMNHYRAIDVCYEKLVTHVGEDEAVKVIDERMNTIK